MFRESFAMWFSPFDTAKLGRYFPKKKLLFHDGMMPHPSWAAIGSIMEKQFHQTDNQD
jgi:hypothetical protein